MLAFFDSFLGKPKEEVKGKTEEGDQLSYTVKLDDWLRGEKLFHTGLYKKHPEVKRRAYKALIEETIKERGTLELAYGKELVDKEYVSDGLFLGCGMFPLSVDDDKVVCREYYEGMPPGKTARKTLRLNKIELIRFLPLVTPNDYSRNVREINDSIQKNAIIETISYLDEKGFFQEDGACQLIPLRTDDNFLYYRKEKSHKEEKIRLRCIRFIQYCIYE